MSSDPSSSSDSEEEEEEAEVAGPSREHHWREGRGEAHFLLVAALGQVVCRGMC